jgi:hypothetical protein
VTSTSSDINVPEGLREEKLPRSDWILLPVISLLTVLVMLAASEALARMIWPEQGDVCLVPSSDSGYRFRPNCKSRAKSAEGPWVENQYNECGYRTPESCGPKPRGTIRVAVLGASDAYGYMVPYGDSFPALTAEALTRQCKRPVEFQELSVEATYPVSTYRRTTEALALKPDMLLWALNSSDVDEIDHNDVAHRNDPPGVGLAARPPAPRGWMIRHVVAGIKDLRSIKMLRHFMQMDPAIYLNLYLLHDDSANYLRPPLSPQWQQRISDLDVLVGDMSRKANAASVPMEIFIVATAAQAALVNTDPRPGIDPQAFQMRVAEIGNKYGVPVIFSLQEFAGHRDAMSLFYSYDGHAGPQGHHILAYALDRGLLASGNPVFAGCTRPE